MKTTLIVILLLVASNTFMTIAWYGHLKYKHVYAPHHDPRKLADRAYPSTPCRCPRTASGTDR